MFYHCVIVTAILGIPTVRRSSQSYLLSTLNDLINKMSANEKNDTLIVVLIAEVGAVKRNMN